MDKQHRWFRNYLVCKIGGTRQRAGISQYARYLSRTPQPDMKRHHRALAEAREGDVSISQVVLIQFSIDKGVYGWSSRVRARC